MTLNFHPDRVSRGTPILRSLADSGVYVSQFVTGTGNGGLTAHPGGDRWRWESRLFGGAYDHAPASERPSTAPSTTGAVRSARPAVRLLHFRLTAATLERTTFCYPESCLDPSDFGTAAHGARRTRPRRPAGRLDDCVEAHVHGPVRLDRDVEALVLDPCYRGTAVEDAARRLPCPVEWHPGFRLTVEELRRHPATGARALSSWARRSPRPGCSTHAWWERRSRRDGTTLRRSRRCGTAWRASGRRSRPTIPR
ncbi:DUF3626 domain-containing protein [Streptomyces thermocarboxydus]